MKVENSWEYSLQNYKISKDSLMENEAIYKSLNSLKEQYQEFYNGLKQQERSKSGERHASKDKYKGGKQFY